MKHFIILCSALLLTNVASAAYAQDAAKKAPAKDADDASYSSYKSETAGSAVSDPLEPMNRAIHGFNQIVDKALLKPVAQVYRAAVPAYGRQRVTNVLNNINEPVNMVNSLLQGDVDHAFTSFWRFTLNTTFGIAGIFDFAETNANLKYRKEDFGQTLATWGVGHGAYLVLPIIGPSSLRDTVGFVADIFTNPYTYMVDDAGNIARGVVTAIDTRTRTLDFTDDVERNALDPYATYRSSYTQYRAKQVRDTTAGKRYSRTPVCH